MSGKEKLDPGDWDIRRAPIIDYTAWPPPEVAKFGKLAGLDGYILGFLSASGDDKKVYWGGYKDFGHAVESNYGKADIAAFRAQGGRLIFSFDGETGAALEAVEVNVDKIVKTYEGIIDNYQITHMDFTPAIGTLANSAEFHRHIAAVTRLLTQHPGLKISYTLPVDATPALAIGFNAGGVAMLERLADAGIRPSLVSGMMMEFSAEHSPSTFEGCELALNAMHETVSQVFPSWNSQQVWRRLGFCPMFGRNHNGQVFTLADQRKLLDFANQHNLGCLSGWDATRDYNQGNPESANDPSRDNVAKYTCVEQKPLDFSKLIATYRPAV